MSKKKRTPVFTYSVILPDQTTRRFKSITDCYVYLISLLCGKSITPPLNLRLLKEVKLILSNRIDKQFRIDFKKFQLVSEITGTV